MKFPKILIGAKDSNVIFSVVKPKTKQITCERCGEPWHYADAKYCSQCGQKLTGASEKGSR